MRILLAVAAAAALGGCIYINEEGDWTSQPSNNSGPARGELLYAAAVELEGVRIRTSSNGCTTEESFDVDVDRVNTNPDRFVVRFTRDNPDHCRAMIADGVELYFSRERLGIPYDAYIRVANSVAR